MSLRLAGWICDGCGHVAVFPPIRFLCGWVSGSSDNGASEVHFCPECVAKIPRQKKEKEKEKPSWGQI